MLLYLCALAITCAQVIATDYKDPPQTFQANLFTAWESSDEKVGSSKRGGVNVQFDADDGSSDYVSLIRLDIVETDPYKRGYAQGFLLAREIAEFATVQLDRYFADMVLDIDISQFPEPIQPLLEVIKIKGAMAAPAAFRKALGWVWDKEVSYVPEYLILEMNGIAAGICDASPIESCDVVEWTETIRHVNMLPELIRMACTAFGAWGEASAPDANLVQLRALDFGGGPFANYTVLTVYRSPEEDTNAFASLSFPGFVGVITGVSQSGIGVSEKVWMTYNKYSLLPGSYDGEADVLVLRDILEQSKTKEEAEKYLENASRTWAIWIGIGDYASNTFDLVGYQQNSSVVYNDETMPSMTGQPYIKHVAYVDKHPQPSHDGPNGTLPTALNDFYGNISLETTKIITQYHQTGDLHIASYDFGNKKLYVSVGRINGKGEYGPEGGDTSVWKAYNRPYLSFNLDDLWIGK